MKLETLEIVSLREWCRPVAASELKTADGNCAFWADEGEEIRLPPPDFTLDPADSEAIGRDCRNVAMNLVDFTQRTDGRAIAKLRDVVVRNGSCTVMLNRHLALAESYHNRFVFEFIKAGPISYADARVGLTVNGETCMVDLKLYPVAEIDQRLDGPAVMLTARWAETYLHWIIEVLPRLWYRDEFPWMRKLPVVVPDALSRFQRDTLQAFGIEDRVAFTGQALSAETLYFPTFFAPAGLGREHVAWLRRKMFAAYGVAEGRPERLIYVSRRKARARNVLNEDEVMAELAPRGFEAVCLEDLSMREQLALFANARLVIAPNGSGTINFLFAPPGAGLIDLVVGSDPHPMFWVMAKLIDCRYGRLRCKDTPDGRSDLTVDMAGLKALLAQAL
ncbi:MAG: glycosyltransferase family 61 protein [Alphaproteobacteria bacterium]|nr:glycosyltransferase family 61 protein [Alphaproteobacteria bacterium]